MENPVIILGAKGLGKVALDIFRSNQVEIYCFLDDDTSLHNTQVEDVTVLGSTDDGGFLKLIGPKCEAFVASDDNRVRAKLVEMLLEDRKSMPVNAIHKHAFIEPSAHLSHGTLVQAGAVISSFAKIGNHCLIGANATIEHEVQLADLVQIGSGSVIGSSTQVGKGAFIGTGVVVVPGIKIGAKARIGAGSVVVTDVKDGETVFGNPARKVE